MYGLIANFDIPSYNTIPYTYNLETSSIANFLRYGTRADINTQNNWLPVDYM